jgi:hypothetical protein
MNKSSKEILIYAILRNPAQIMLLAEMAKFEFKQNKKVLSSCVDIVYRNRIFEFFWNKRQNFTEIGVNEAYITQ